MEQLYRTLIPYGQVHCMAWSGNNLIALSLSKEAPKYVTERNERVKIRSLLVFDPDRPWTFHRVTGDCKSTVCLLEWSQDGTRLLALDQNSIIHIWRMKQQNINSWVCAQKQEPGPSVGTVVHSAWLDYRPMVTINHSRQAWPEVLEFQQFSPLLKMLTGNAFICIYSTGKVQVTSASLTHSTTRMAETKLEGKSTPITVTKTFVTPNGSVLCAVGYADGQIRVYSLSLSLSWGTEFTLASTLATEVPRSSAYQDTITQLRMLPLPDGCVLHACFNGQELCQWSVKDITTSGSYQAKKEKSYTTQSTITCLTASSICLGLQDTPVENEIIVLDEMSGVQREGRGWPVEVLVVATDSGQVAVLNRDTYTELQTLQLPSGEDMLYPVPKRARLQPPSISCHAACLSPNASCVAIATGEHLHLVQFGSLLLGVKDSSSMADIARCSRLLSLSTVTHQCPWDLVAAFARLDGEGFLKRLLFHYQEDYRNNGSTLSRHVCRQYLTTCSLIHACSENGLHVVLGYRNVSRLQAMAGVLGLSLMSDASDDSWLMESLQAACTNNASEESVEALGSHLNHQEFLIKPDTASQLQGHAHWLLELAIKLVATMASRSTTVVPEMSGLKLLREGLLLVYVWNKVLPQPIIPVTDGAISLLFKAVTKYLQSPSSALPEDLQAEIACNLPQEKHPNLLTLTKAAHLQGFLNGLVMSRLPEIYQRDMPPYVRPQVQQNFNSMDPYSPLTLVVPRGLSPPWRDCFVDEQRDVIHGGVIMKNLIQNAKLKQCSRCRSWTVVPDSSQPSQPAEGKANVTTHPVQQWRTCWTTSCLCGGPWTTTTIDTSKRT